MRTCGDCAHFKPYVNPDTGRVKPSQPGTCGWVFPWPEELPTAYTRLHLNLSYDCRLRPPTPSAIGAWINADRCPCFEAKETKPTAMQVALPIE